MADRPHAIPDCAFCDWKGQALDTPSAPVLRQMVQEAVLTHHISEHGFPSSPGEPRWEWLTYDPANDAAITLPRRFAGIAVVDDGVVRLFEDERADRFPGLGPLVRAVTIARLRAWADLLDPPEDTRG